MAKNKDTAKTVKYVEDCGGLKPFTLKKPAQKKTVKKGKTTKK